MVETVSGVVDLRRQFRLSRRQSEHHPENMKTSVRAYTRDGIELNANIFALFTIGQNPDLAPSVLTVAYLGDPRPGNLRVVIFDEVGKSIRIKNLDDELDEFDKLEIDNYSRHPGIWFPYTDIKPGNLEPEFNPERVFSAVYSQARKFSEGEIMRPWTDLPVQVGIDYFRELLSQVNFDELYQMDARGNIKIGQIRRQLRLQMRNSGSMSFRILKRKDRQPLKIGSFYPRDDLMVSTVSRLYNRKILRERGIQLSLCGFSDPIPDEVVFRQWLASWRSSWERDTLTVRAATDLEVNRILSRARAEAQEELWLSLREIFQAGNNSMEVIALRIFQALESIAADNETRQLLPEETINMLKNIHDWLLPQDIVGGTTPAPTPIPTPAPSPTPTPTPTPAPTTGLHAIK